MLQELVNASARPATGSIFRTNFKALNTTPNPKVLLLAGLEAVLTERVKFLSARNGQVEIFVEAIGGARMVVPATGSGKASFEFTKDTMHAVNGIPQPVGLPDETLFPMVLKLAFLIANAGTPAVQGSPRAVSAKKLVDAYERLVTVLEGMGELPLTGTTPAAKKMAAFDDPIAFSLLVGPLTEVLDVSDALIAEFSADCEVVSLIDPIVSDPSVDQSGDIMPWRSSATAPQAAATAPRAKKPVAPKLPWWAEADVPFYMGEIVATGFASMYAGGVPGICLVGEPGTKKTTGIKACATRANLPLTKMSFSPETPRDAVLGNVRMEVADGKVTPKAVLGALTEPFRQSMLLAILLTVRNHTAEAETLVASFPESKTKTLWMNVIKDTGDAAAWKAIEQQCCPTDSPEWKWTNKLYHGLYVPERAGVCHVLFIDELHHLVGNPSVLYLLQNAMEDERKLNPSEAGFDCHALYGYNLRIIGAGNPSGSHGIPPALKSRFPFISYVGAQKQALEKADLKTALNRAKERAQGKVFLQPELCTEDVFNPAYIGLKIDVDLATMPDLPATLENKIFAMADYVKDQYRQNKAKGFIDKRAIFATAFFAQFLIHSGLPNKQVVERIVNPLLPELVGYRPDGSLANESTYNQIKADLENRLNF